LDGDGKKDLLVAYKKGSPQDEARFFAVFWNQAGRFSAKPDLVIAAEPDTCAFDVADVDGDAGEEVLGMGPSGIAAHSLRGRRWGDASVLTRDPTLFFQPARGELPRLRVVHDLTAVGSGNLVVPGLGAMTVYGRGANGFSPVGRLEIPMDSTVTQRVLNRHRGSPAFNLTHRFPSLHVGDADGDGRKDLLVTLEDRLAVFRQSPDGTFPSKASFARDFAIRTPEELRDASSQASISVRDIDGDGVVDLVVRKQVAHGLASALATSLVFFGQKGGGYALRPDQTLKSEGASGSEVELVDLTGDGHPDLVVPSVNIGVFAIIRVLTTKTLNVNFQLFPFLPASRRFADKPAAERVLKFHVSLSGNTDLQALDEQGDYNGDRRPDLVFGTGEDELSIFAGIGGKEIFTADAVETIPVRGYGEVQPVDLDGKGRDDLVLSFPSTKDHRSEIVVLVNRGPWP